MTDTRPQDTRDEGFALISVIGFGMVLMLISSLLIGNAMGSIKQSRREQDYLAAVAAAQAGIDDYLSRLNANNTYWQSVDCTNIAMRRVFTGTVPCGWGSGTAVGWLSLPGARNPANQSCAATPTPANCSLFHYDVDTSATLSNGSITVTSTGRSNKVSRSVRATIRRKGFAEYLYFSDIESVDPANRAVYGTNNTTAQTVCSRHYWDNPARDTDYCSDIYFVAGDKIDGPLHTNDALLLSGNPAFNGAVTTSYPACAPNAQGKVPPATDCYRSTATPTFAKGIGYAAQIQLPPTNSALRAQVTPGTATGTAGCLFTGPTRIKFNSGGTMTVWSPYTLTVNPGCGPVSPNGSTFAVPDNNVIFVQNVPSSQVTPLSGNLTAGSIGGYPQANDANFNYGEYDRRAGTLFVDGTLSGRVTIGTDNNAIITGDLTYAGGATGADSLGLVANNSVQIYHPVNCTNWTNSNTKCTAGTNITPPSGTDVTDITVHAVILSLAHSFTVQLYNLGAAQGTLSVFGSISQKYRGAVGSFSGSTINSGYRKNYSYDPRLKFAPPPYYLNPVDAAYNRSVFAEVTAAY